MKEYCLAELCQSVSETYRKNASRVVLINTSDVYDGEVLNHSLTDNKDLRGQFKKTFRRNDILFSEIRPANRRMAFVDFSDTEAYIVSTKLMVIRANERLIRPKFLYIFLSSQEILDRLQTLAETRSGTFPQITFSTEIAPLSIMLPSLEEQDRILSYYESLSTKIRVNRAINDNLQQQMWAVFNKFFVEPSTFPDGWHVGRLTDIADYTNGLAMQRFRPLDGEIGIPVLKIKELRQGFCDADSELCSPNLDPKYLVDDGDVIFSWSGSLLVDIWCGGRCGLNQHLFKVTSNYDKWFYYLWTLYHLDRFIKIAADKATTMGHIQRGDLVQSRVIIPNSSDLERIGEFISPILSQIVNSRLENNHLATLRDTLLPKLMSGEIDVSEVEF